MTEQEAIELLNEIDNLWRDKFDTPWEALDFYEIYTEPGADALQDAGFALEELDFND